MEIVRRKRVCPKCGRKLWIVRDFYSRTTPYCKDCSRKLKREEYARNRKVPDGLRYNAKNGLCYDHNGCSKKIHWSPQMISDLKRLFPTHKNEDVADIIGVSPRTLIRKARELGIEKNTEWMRRVRNEHLLMMHVYNKCRGNSGMFKKGQHASPATEFKPKNKKS